MNARLQEYDGRVVTTTHFGPYARLGDAHSEIRQWSAERGHRLSGICWEIYGHWDESWNADPSKIRSDVFHLVEDEKANPDAPAGDAGLRALFIPASGARRA